jgi:hypothetical protein
VCNWSGGGFEMKTKLLAIFMVVVLAGCISVPVPTPEQNTLLAGKFLVNWNSDGKMSGGNGAYKFGIKVYFQNGQTGKVISVSTQKDGWFFTSKLAGGSYTIQKFYIEQMDGNAIYQMTLNGPFFIAIGEGKVNNIGVIQIDIGSDSYSHRLVDYDVVKFDFQNEFPDSEWNSYKWEDIYGFNR